MQEEKKFGPLKEVAGFCRKAAAEGAVLLRNKGQMLPIVKEDNVALFGRCYLDYFRSGTGSGGSVNVEYTTNLMDGLRNYPWVTINKAVAEVYEKFVKENPADTGNGEFASESWFQKEMVLEEDLVKEAAVVSNKALVVIGRTAGEEKDNLDEPGSYRLTEEEKLMISLVTKYFENVAIIYNVSNIMDTSWLDESWCHGHIKAVLYTWHGGIEGGNGAADVLVGAVTPSGHLTDTIAQKLSDYPAYPNYGDEERNFYEEDIYVGYRYFETFCPEKVLYPFGFGLSYTTFDWDIVKAGMSGEGKESVVEISVCVKNTGAYAGKEVMQVYVEAPQGLLGKPRRELVQFAKTKCLQPAESEEMTLRIPVTRFASYDDGGITQNKSCYVLEAGEYRFYVGNNCRNTKEALCGGKAPFSLNELLVTEKLTEASAPVQAFRRMKPSVGRDGIYEVTYEPVPLRTIDLAKRIEDNLPKAFPIEEKGITFGDVKKGKASLEAFVSQLSVRELHTLVRGEGMCNPRVTSGTAAAFGGVSDELAERGIPAACASDGPSGIRRDTGEKATQLPIGTLLACTFNTELMEELFYWEGKELVNNEIDTLLGPGINIHRYPLNGRNFEYFSEDPYVTGAFAAACERGLGRNGITGTIKHFACNNQEIARHTVDSVVSERALREIYLRGFKMAIDEGGARAVMTTYNPMNGFQNANHYDLVTTILRGEWGYTGVVMTDWWADLNDVIKGGRNVNLTNMCSMVRSQNDVYMVVNNNGAAINARGDDLDGGIEAGRITLGELQRSAMNILRFLLSVPASDREVKVLEPAAIAAQPFTNQKAGNIININDVAKIDIADGKGDKEILTLKVDKAGIYGVNASVMSKEKQSAQMLCQLILNGRKAVDIQTHSTNGNWYVQRAGKIILQEGLYEMQITHIRPGINLSFVEFVEE
ncbi:MAG: glycoside hydrolase family 3 protein [Lachnospiraceae bacterium]